MAKITKEEAKVKIRSLIDNQESNCKYAEVNFGDDEPSKVIYISGNKYIGLSTSEVINQLNSLQHNNSVLRVHLDCAEGGGIDSLDNEE